jgi:hypothetical protein
MNVIIVVRQGIMDAPILVKDDVTAQAAFDQLAEELLGDDISEVNLHFDDQLLEVNNLLRTLGIEVQWFEGIQVNEYVNH